MKCNRKSLKKDNKSFIIGISKVHIDINQQNDKESIEFKNAFSNLVKNVKEISNNDKYVVFNMTSKLDVKKANNPTKIKIKKNPNP